MPQLRKDPLTGRWVIVDHEKPRLDFTVQPHVKSSKTCPFCPGNEAMTPPQIASYPRKSGRGLSDWQVRVVPNKFPALKIEERPEKSAEGLYDRVGGFGAHEVIIENPDHLREFSDLEDDETEQVIRAYRDRCLDLRKDPRLKYILLFKNYGRESGASMEHPHAQLIALPIVPSRVQSEVRGAEQHAEYAERCLFCDMLRQEEGGKSRIIHTEDGFTVMAPFAARFPFETWILPSSHESSFDRISDGGMRSLGRVLKRTLRRLRERLGDPSYNYMFHTLPISPKESDSFHWHIEIIPHLTRVAGFELGSGFYINPTPPELAAERLRF
jgi:UDPglucose--hexose-1-phosphate uridylyltransferase